MVYITGQLVDPMNNPEAGVVIRVEALDTKVTLAKCEASTKTDSCGDYDFQLVDGLFKVEVLYSDEYIVSGNVLIDENTTSPLTLAELLTDYIVVE